MTPKSTFKRTTLAPALLVLLLCGLPQAAAAQCQSGIERELDRLNVAPAEVDSLKVVKQIRAPNPDTNYVYDAWVRLRSCGKGYLVIQLTRGCAVKQSYSRGDCRLDGVPAY